MKIINKGYSKEEIRPIEVEGECKFCFCKFQLETDEEKDSIEYDEKRNGYYNCPNCREVVKLNITLPEEIRNKLCYN